jgi:hypothetical protein
MIRAQAESLESCRSIGGSQGDSGPCTRIGETADIWKSSLMESLIHSDYRGILFLSRKIL